MFNSELHYPKTTIAISFVTLTVISSAFFWLFKNTQSEEIKNNETNDRIICAITKAWDIHVDKKANKGIASVNVKNELNGELVLFTQTILTAFYNLNYENESACLSMYPLYKNGTASVTSENEKQCVARYESLNDDERNALQEVIDQKIVFNAVNLSSSFDSYLKCKD